MAASRVAHVCAQAKVNLGLHILGREATGYHQLETFFHQLELADDIHVTRTSGERVLACTGRLPVGGLGPARSNLAWRAAAAYAEAAGWDGGFHIALDKRIPAGGGLGGGSADAGAVLRACEWLAAEPLGAEALRTIAASLGSDVPFLAGESAAAIGTGRGEVLEPIPPLPVREVALVFPTFGIPTKSAYEWLATDRAEASRDSVPSSSGVAGLPVADWGRLSAAAANDFEPVVGQRFPEIPAILRRLRDAGALLAMMSGSGSTLFGIFDATQVAHAREVLVALPGGAEIVWTRTASRVVPVRASG